MTETQIGAESSISKLQLPEKIQTIIDDNRDVFEVYTNLDADSYRVFLRHINHIYRAQLEETFQHIPFDGNTCLVTVGSDGKGERHAQSKTEVVIITTRQDHEKLSEELVSWYDEVNGEGSFAGSFDLRLHVMPEVKIIGNEDAPLSYVYPYLGKEGHAVYPDRVLNTGVIAGNKDIWIQARKQVLKEMSQNKNISQHIRRSLKNQLRREYVESLKTGVFKGNAVFQLTPPLQFYDEDPGKYTVGFKIPVMRAVQRKLDIITYESIRSGVLIIEEASHELPADTVDRLEYFIRRGLIDEDAASAAEEAYVWFEQQYHFAQELYKVTRKRVELPFDLGLFDVNRKKIIDFTTLSI